MSEQIQDKQIQRVVDALASEAETSRLLGSIVGALGVIAGTVVASTVAAPIAGLAAGVGGAIVAGLALARKLKAENSIAAVKHAFEDLEVDQRRVLADRFSELQVRNLSAEGVDKVLGQIKSGAA